jgi:hypothetical protein
VGRILRVLGLFAALPAVAAAGCGDGKLSVRTPERQLPPGAAPTAAIFLVAPQDGATVGRTFTAEVTMSGVKTQGRLLHFSLDGGQFDHPRGAGRYTPASRPQMTFRDVPRGEHTLTVVVANGNRTDTDVQAASDFFVK